MGVNDALNPNNEFVEITVDPRFASAPVALRGFLLQNKLGETSPWSPGLLFGSTRAKATQPGKPCSGTEPNRHGTTGATVSSWSILPGVATAWATVQDAR